MLHHKKREPRRVNLTQHAFDQAQAKFEELAYMASQDYPQFVRKLVASAGHADRSRLEHVVLDQGFLDGHVDTDDGRVFISFAYRMSDNGKTFNIMTSLLPDECIGAGGRVRPSLRLLPTPPIACQG
jgi:hypothetical protein